jgi:hypothetical protein
MGDDFETFLHKICYTANQLTKTKGFFNKFHEKGVALKNTKKLWTVSSSAAAATWLSTLSCA